MDESPIDETSEDPDVETTVNPSARAEAPLFKSLAPRLSDVTVAGATAHGLGPLTARAYRALGKPVPQVLRRQERAARIAERFAPVLLERIAAAVEAPILVFKGPEVAARYPSATRTYSDIDLLVGDAPRAQRALLDAGFTEVQGDDDHDSELHHLAPLRWPSLPLAVEVHGALKWPRALTPPKLDSIFGAAVPALSSHSGLLAPSPEHHALILAAHAWAHTPLRKARDVLDVAAVASEAEATALESYAADWDLLRIVRTMLSTAHWLVHGEARPLAVTLWARHLIDLRDATVLEGHVERWLSPFWALPIDTAVVRASQMIAHEFTVAENETRREKLGRAARAARHALTAKSKYGWGADEVPVTKKRKRDGH